MYILEVRIFVNEVFYMRLDQICSLIDIIKFIVTDCPKIFQKIMDYIKKIIHEQIKLSLTTNLYKTTIIIY